MPVLHPLSWVSHAISCFTLMSSTGTCPPLSTAHRLATESAVTNAQHDAQMSCWLCTGVTTALYPFGGVVHENCLPDSSSIRASNCAWLAPAAATASPR